VIFALTQGPVFSLWFASEQKGLNPALAPHLATFFVIQIPALILVSRQRFTNRDWFGPIGMFGIFCAWMLMTVAWASNGQHSIVEATSLFTTFVCGVYFGKRFTHLEKLWIIVIAMQPGLLLSRYAIAHNWELSKSVEGFWVGIYFNRNSLAPVAMVSVIAASALLVDVYRKQSGIKRVYQLCLLIDIAIFGLVTAIRTHSNTPFGGVAAFTAVYVFWEIVRKSRLKKLLFVEKSKRMLFSTFIFAAAVFSWAAIQMQNKVLELFGETIDFNGRSEIWKYSWTGFLEKPLSGWGWMSAWRSWAFMRMNLWWTVEGVIWSHNAYLDMLLGGGVLAVALFFAAAILGLYRLIPTQLENQTNSWAISFVFFYLAMCTQESFIIGNHFLWMIFVALLASDETILTRPNRSLIA
jgi:O-antigen ligase